MATPSNPVLNDLTKSVSIRKTHPNMYRALMSFALMNVALAANLYLTQPTFDPYDIPKDVIASVFLVLGITKVVFLNLWHNLKLVRLTTAACVAFQMFWGLSNTQQAFAGRSSFQLPILYVALSVLQLFFLLEPASNPLTTNGRKK